MIVADDVLSVLSIAQCAGNALQLPPQQLDRQLYVRTNKVIEAAGGKWNRKTRAHVFDGDAAEAMEQVLLTGRIAPPEEFGFFQTPVAVARRLVDLAQLKPAMLVLEPSIGLGAIARFVAAREDVKIHSYELQQKLVDQLVAQGIETKCRDFLDVPPLPAYDRVVMNPPFAKRADIHHVTHAFRFLRPGGRLISVMSAGVVFRNDRLTMDFRAQVSESGGTIEMLPEGAFKESGTMVRTVVVRMGNF